METLNELIATFADPEAVWCDTQRDTVDAEEAVDRNTQPGYLVWLCATQWGRAMLHMRSETEDRGNTTEAELPVKIKHALFSNTLLFALKLEGFYTDNMLYKSIKKEKTFWER